MLEGIKRWLTSDAPTSQWTDAARWAKKEGYEFRRTKEDDGFVVEGAFDGRPWRLEWGPPQRAYITSRELRLRMEMRLAPELQMLVMGRRLLDTLERETFERYTESMQTQIDVSTPEEMRWLAMFPKVPLVAMTRTVRSRFAAVASDPKACEQWVDTALSEKLIAASEGFLKNEPPFVMMTLRGRIYLRLELAEPDTAAMAGALGVLESAAGSVLQLGAARDDRAERGDRADWHSTASTAWQNQLQDDEPGSGGKKR